MLTMSSPKRKKRALPSRNKTVNTPDDGNACPSCVDFGKDRKEKFPEAFFCSNCDAWDLEGVNPKCKQTSRRFKCQAKLGPNWFHPTVVKVDIGVAILQQVGVKKKQRVMKRRRRRCRSTSSATK
jgi:hypothetical protein